MILQPFRGDKGEYERLSKSTISPVDAPDFGVNTRWGPVVVNVEDWRPGDVILVDTPESVIIKSYQWLLGAGPDSAWTHAAIYAGDDRIWDAMPDLHIQERTIGELVRQSVPISLYRLRNAQIEKHLLARLIEEQAKQTYAVGGYLGVLASRMISNAPAPEHPDHTASRPVICSIFVERVLMLAAGRQVLPHVPVSVPADFATSTAFEPVSLSWRRIANR